MKPAIVLTLARFYELVPAGRDPQMARDLAGAPVARRPRLPDPRAARSRHLHHGCAVRGYGDVPRRPAAGGCSLAPAAAAAVAAPIVYGMMHGYQRKRIDVFLDPESDPLGAGYHIAQSKIAIGSGGIWGKGFLHGSQSHLDYLPEGHTDFVFATMAEEWGLVGGVILILRLRRRDPLGHAGQRQCPHALRRSWPPRGLSATIFFYVSINLMMVMGLAPVVGVPLPLVSFGGSAVMTVMLCLGLLMALERQQRTASRSLRRLKCPRLRTSSAHATGAAAQARNSGRSIRLTTAQWTHSSVGRAADS